MYIWKIMHKYVCPATPLQLERWYLLAPGTANLSTNTISFALINEKRSLSYKIVHVFTNQSHQNHHFGFSLHRKKGHKDPFQGARYNHFFCITCMSA